MFMTSAPIDWAYSIGSRCVLTGWPKEKRTGSSLQFGQTPTMPSWWALTSGPLYARAKAAPATAVPCGSLINPAGGLTSLFPQILPFG